MISRYQEYKNSGIDWIGKIPSTWNMSKVKYVSKNHDGKRVPLSGSERADKDGIFPYYGATGQVDSIDDYIFDGQYVLVGEDGAPFFDKTKQVAYRVNGKFWVNNHAHILSNQDDFDLDYFCYVLNLVDYKEYISGSTRDKLTKGDLLNIPIIFPSKWEQIKIAEYLDYQTGLIDAIIEKKQQLIAKLKEQRQAIINEAVTKGLDSNAPMKDSGVEWLGEIPEHWMSSKIKFVTTIFGRIGFRGYTKEDLVLEGEGALTLGAKHIDKNNNLDIKDPEYISWEKYYESPEIMVKKGDVIFTQRGSLGKVCHINEEIPKATINPSMVLLKDILISNRFLYFWLCSDRIQNEVKLLQANTAVPMISQFQLGNFPILLPPKEEQLQIVNFLDQTLLEIDEILKKNNQLIKKLKLFRQSIISEAVTGKIDVREWEPKTAEAV